MTAELYRLFFEESQDALIAVDLESSKVVAVNKTFQGLTGFLQDEVLGETLTLLSAHLSQDYARERRFDHATLVTPGYYNDLIISTKDRDVRFVSAKIKHIQVAGQKIAMAVLSDDTERQFLIRDLAMKHQGLEQAYADLEKVHEELKASQERMAQSSKLAALGELAAGLSHELGQPLTGVKGFAQEAQDIIKTTPKPSKRKIRELLGDIVSNADKMAQLLGHFRSFARHERKSFYDENEKLEAVKFHDVYVSVTKLMQRQFKNHGIEIDYQSSPEPRSSVLARSHPLEQILINLLSNSRDALVEKSKSHPAYRPRVRIWIEEDSAYSYLNVEDNASGIPAAHQLKIFDPFFTTKEVGKGPGLGLSISYGIAHRYHGDLQLKRSDQHGSHFVLKIPKAPADLNAAKKGGGMNVRVPRILVVDDEADVRRVIVSRMERRKIEVREADSAIKALALMEHYQPTVIVTDLRMPEMDGFEFLSKIKGIPVIIMTGHGDKESAIRAVDLGAFGFFEKPFDLDSLEISIKRANENYFLQSEKNALLSRLDELCHFQNREIENLNRNKDSSFVGRSPPIEELRQTLTQLSKKPFATVFIGGETGTGKEVAARELHLLTHDSLSSVHAPFVALNCSAIPPDLLESELFGHEKGAFSGASAQRIGLAEAARAGTLFLDEIGDMDLRHQAKLLRLVQERKFRRVGSNKEFEFHGRIVAATHRDLRRMSQQNLFREDLFYRLSVVSVDLPPLRKRGADILLLAEHLCAKHGVKGISPERVAELLSYSWPGNIRELNNWIERASILSKLDNDQRVNDPLPRSEALDAPVLSKVQRPHFEANEEAMKDIKLQRSALLDEFDRTVIEKALIQCEGNLSKTAILIGLDRKNLARRMKDLSIENFGSPRTRRKAA